jgi:4'-phosphopantetheinyl transferase
MNGSMEQPSHADLSIHQTEVHVWSASLTFSAEKVAAFEQTLSDDERLRASRFRFERDRSRFIAGRGILREILSRYLHLAPNQVQFAYGQYGKPTLALLHHTGLEFNLSHSGDRALYAIADRKQIGIDLEQIRSLPDLDQLVKQCLSLKEQQALFRLDPTQQQTAFFQYWTGKEAYLKAIGHGLMIPLTQIEIPLHTQQPAKVLSKFTSPMRDWYLQTILLDEEYRAAIVLEGEDWQIIHHLFQL